MINLATCLIWNSIIYYTGRERMMTFCDFCGDIVVAYIPVKVMFYKRGKITLNICLDCWVQHFQGKNRKLQVAKVMDALTKESWSQGNIGRWRRRLESEFSEKPLERRG